MKRSRIVKGLIGLVLAGVLPLVLVTWTRPDLAYQWAMDLERWIAGLSVQSVQVDGMDWIYLEGGDGPTLVLIHGFSGDKDNWVRLARHLTHHYRVIAPDLPGFGDSDPALDQDYRIFAQSDRIARFLTAINVSSAHIGGNSMGGMLAGSLAERHGERVESLWLLAPAGVMSATPSELMQRIETGQSNPLIPASRDDFAFTIDFIFTNPPFVPDSVLDFLADRLVERRELLQHIFLDAQRDFRTFEEVIAGYSGAVLITWGEDDRVLHVSGTEVLQGLLPQAQVDRIPGVGHVPMIEVPQRTAVEYRMFQSSLPYASTAP